jgi:DNA-binding transcriptional MerR regulator
MQRNKNRKVMRMGDLVRKTGVRKATIHFYISQGLLPKPKKRERNVAYYDETYVERIRLIKELQLKRFLPLKAIKEVLSQTDGKLSASELNVIRIGGRCLIQSEERRFKCEPQTLDELSERTGLPVEDIREMERCEIISSAPDKHGRKVYQDIDIRIVEAFAEVRKAGFAKEHGFEVEGFQMHSDLIGVLAIEEVKDFARRLHAQSLDDPEFLPRLVENGLESTNFYVSQLRRKKLLEAIRLFIENGEDAFDHSKEKMQEG